MSNPWTCTAAMVLFLLPLGQSFGQQPPRRSIGQPPPQRSNSRQLRVPPSQQFQRPANPQVPAPSAQDIINLFIPQPQPGGNRPGYYDDDNRDNRNFRNDAPRPQQPAPRQIPSEDDLARMSDDDLHKLLQSTGSGLQQQLPADWQKHLQLAGLAPDLAAGPNGVSAEARQRLRQLADKLDKVAGNPVYRSIFQRWDFQVLQRALHIYSLPPLERSHRQLLAHGAALQSQLGKLHGGDGWTNHLAVPQTIASTPESLDPTWLQTVRQRYEKVQQDPKYSLIARLPEFDATREALANYLDKLPVAAGPTPKVAGSEVAKGNMQSPGRPMPGLKLTRANGQ